MKKIILAAALVFGFTGVYSQTAITFCTAVDAHGYCSLANDRFISTPDSPTALIFMKVTNTQGIPSSKLVYKTFKVGAKGEETHNSSFNQNIESGWEMSWQPDRFPSPGIYMVRVYNDLSEEIANKSFELRKDW